MANSLTDLLDFLRSKEAGQIVPNALASINRGVITNTLGAPADMANMIGNLGRAGVGYLGNKTGLLSPSQMPQIVDEPIGGSEWIGNKLQQVGLLSSYRNPIAETIAGGLLGPAVGAAVSARAPQIARGLLQMKENAAAPSQMANQGQRGMIRIPGRGQIPETRSEVEMLNTRFNRLLDDAGAQYSADKSGVSPARYTYIDGAGEGGGQLKVRVSDHLNVHGADISVDPHTGTTFEEMLQQVRNAGVPVASRVKPASRAVIDDATLFKIYGEEVAKRIGVDNLRGRYKWVDKPGYPGGGHWTEK